MKQLEERILAEGIVKDGEILRVDSFLNHQMDPALACIAAEEFGCRAVFAKKVAGRNSDADVYATKITSFTKGKVYDVTVSKRFLQPEDRVLILDDFLANGCALEGLMDLVHQAGATLCGCGIAIEKGFQEGGKKIRAKGIRVESLAIIESMSGNSLTFSQREE